MLGTEPPCCGSLASSAPQAAAPFRTYGSDCGTVPRFCSPPPRAGPCLIPECSRGNGCTAFASQCAENRSRPPRRRPSRPPQRFFRAAATGTRRKLHSCPPRLREPNRNCLFGRARAMYTITNVFDLFPHEFPGLCGWGFAFFSVSPSFCLGFRFRHIRLLFWSGGGAATIFISLREKWPGQKAGRVRPEARGAFTPAFSSPLLQPGPLHNRGQSEGSRKACFSRPFPMRARARFPLRI
jgi:hypothetical protein